MDAPALTLDLRDLRAQHVAVIASRRCSILVLGAATDAGARLELRTIPLSSGSPEVLRLCIDTRDALRITLAEDDGEPRERTAWSLVCEPVPRDPIDVMREVIEWARARIAPRVRRGRGAATADARTTAALQPLREVVCEVASAALDRCDQHALALALAFEPRLRARVYTRLVADRSGRLAELVTSCPGALIFALALIERGDVRRSAQVGERLLADVIAGRRLNPALDDALDGWLASLPAPSAPDPAPQRRRRRRTAPVLAPAVRTRLALAETPSARAWPAPASPEARASLRSRQRLLIRRASAEVSARALWLPPPLVLIPEDIPRDERDNARWFAAMKSHAFTLARHPDIDPRWQDAVCRFLSRHAATLARTTEATPAMPVRAVLSYAHAEGRWLDRDSDPLRVRTSWERWHRRTAHREDLAELAARLALRGVRPTSPLPAPLFEPRLACTAELELAPIRSVDGLFAEAREMEHCVAHHVLAALAGKALVFRGVVHGERVTVELARAGGQLTSPWTLRDLRRARNEAPGAAATAAIRAWAVKVIAWQELAERAAHARASAAPITDEVPF